MTDFIMTARMFWQVLVPIQNCNVLLNNALNLFRFAGCKFTFRVSEYINSSCAPLRASEECKQAIKGTNENNYANRNTLVYLLTSVVYIKLSLYITV
jgi:hypothetical protein